MDDLSPALDLPDHLLLLLQEKPEGRSEYELIQQLKRRHTTKAEVVIRQLPTNYHPNLRPVIRLAIFTTPCKTPT